MLASATDNQPKNILSCNVLHTTSAIAKCVLLKHSNKTYSGKMSCICAVLTVLSVYSFK